MDKMFERMRKLLDEETMFLDPFQDNFFEVFTQKRMELLREIRTHHPSSIRELAKFVDRDIKNVFTDLQMLNSCKMIEFVNEGRSKKPVLKTQTVVFTFKRIQQGDNNE
ncbi:MAG: hypothetical protein PHW96_02265 [Candidatus Nanoarchaeia archaeon]|nr:hypothetical protein [Candidatus Nanoarchaeia archaeon]